MTMEKLNKILIGLALLSFFLFFLFLNLNYVRKYPEVFTPSETIEVYTTSETPYFPQTTSSPSNY